ncbi:MAG: hypothetical protein JXA28_13785 [Bacteroidetes bacterium]|nr:hypothetical protein [Bacteroidota bacterium]
MGLLLAAILQGCGLIHSIAGGNVDHERYAKAREAASLEVRYRAALQLSDRLVRGDDPEEADLVLRLGEDFLQRMMQHLRGRTGWIDPETRYHIDSLRTALHPGSAFVALFLSVRNEGYGVDIRLVMDCILALTPDGDALRVDFEPYNITPDVSAPGLLSAAEDLIADVIRVKMGTLKQQFPPMRMPMGFDEQLAIDGNSSAMRGKLNLVITSPRRLVDYRLRVRDVLMFDHFALVTVNLESVRVR